MIEYCSTKAITETEEITDVPHIIQYYADITYIYKFNNV